MDFYTQLFEKLRAHFNIVELETLCFLLGINHEEVANRQTLSVFARSLIEYCDRHNKLPSLIDACRKERPNENWSPAPIYISSSTPSYHLNREEELRAIDNILQENKVVVLVGIAGIGKTQLAIDYAKQNQEHFPGGIFEIDANISIEQGLAKLSNRLYPNALDQSEPGQIALSLEYLKGGRPETKPQQLIIINDLTQLSELTTPVKGNQISLFELPCKLLVTTDTIDKINYPRFEIPRLSSDQALGLFLHHLGRPLDPVKDEDIKEYIAARQLCSLLGNLPLAIKLVANDLRGQSIANYRSNLVKTGQGLKKGINQILDSHWKALQQNNSDAYDVINYIGQFKSNVISIDQLELLSGLGSERFQAVLEVVQKASLIETVALRRLEVHPIVRQFAAERFTGMIKNSFQYSIEAKAIHSLEQTIGSDIYVKNVLIAGECLFDLTWTAVNLRLKVLDGLSHILSDAELSGTELRKVSILRMRVHWLIESSPLSPDEMLTSLDPILRSANSPIDREALLRDIDNLLAMKISTRQKSRFHLYQAQLFAQLYEFIPISDRGGTSQALIEKAQNSIEEANRHLKILNNGKPDDQQLQAQIFHIAATIRGLQAENIVDKGKQEKIWQTALRVYKKAAREAVEYGHDPMLTGLIYGEMANTFALLGKYIEAEKFYKLALSILHKNLEISHDDEVYALRKAHMLIKYGYMYWYQVASKNLNDFTYTDCLKYEKAFIYTREAIHLLQGIQSGTRNLTIAYLNAGDYLFEQQNIAICDETNLGGSPLNYWKKAEELSERYGYWNIFQHVKEAISQLEQ